MNVKKLLFDRVPILAQLQTSELLHTYTTTSSIPQACCMFSALSGMYICMLINAVDFENAKIESINFLGHLGDEMKAIKPCSVHREHDSDRDTDKRLHY